MSLYNMLAGRNDALVIVVKLTPEQKEIWKTIQAQGLEPFKEQVERLFPKEEREKEN